MRAENGERNAQIELKEGDEIKRNITWNKFDFMQKQTIFIPKRIAYKYVAAARSQLSLRMREALCGQKI